MKWGVVGILAVTALPLGAAAGTMSEKQANMEEALRQQEMICSGMVEVGARGGHYFSDHQLAQCLVTLQQQRDEYQHFIASNGSVGSRLVGAATASFR